MRHVQLIAQSAALFGLALQASASFAAKPVSVNLLPDESKVTIDGKAQPAFSFQVKGSSINGKFKIAGPKSVEGEATLALQNLDAGEEKRTSHMREDLELEKHPIAKFVPTSLPWQDPSDVLTKETAAQPFEGKMTLHGVEKPVQGTVATKVEAGKVKYTFTFPLKITDFSVKQRSFLGMKVREDIQVTVETAAKVETL